MNKIFGFLLKLTTLSLFSGGVGLTLSHYNLVVLPTMFLPIVAFYFIISLMAFFVNIKGMEEDAEIAVWFYMASIMIKFLLAAISVAVLTKYFPEQKKNIVFTSFALYPLFEVIVISDVYKRIRT